MRSRGQSFEDVDVVPSYPVSSGEGVVSRCGLDSVECFIIGIVESVAAFVFLHTVDERSEVCRSVYCSPGG